MTDRVHARLLILAVLVMSLVGTLAARAFSLQVVDADQARAAAEDNRVRELVIPAARGMVLDQQGRALAANRISLDVSVDRRELRRIDDDGEEVLGRLAALLGVDADLLNARLQNCGTPGAQKQPNCWNGAPGADPVVARDVGSRLRVRSWPIRRGIRPSRSTGCRPAVPGGDVGRPHAGPRRGRDRRGRRRRPAARRGASPGAGGARARVRRGPARPAGAGRVTVDSAGHRRPAGSRSLRCRAGRWSRTSTPSCRPSSRTSSRPRSPAPGVESSRSPSSRTRPTAGRRSCSTCAPVQSWRWPPPRTSTPNLDRGDLGHGLRGAHRSRSGQPLLNRAVQTALAPASTFKAVSAAAALEAGYSTNAASTAPAATRSAVVRSRTTAREPRADLAEPRPGGLLRHGLLPPGPRAVAGRRWLEARSTTRAISSP